MSTMEGRPRWVDAALEVFVVFAAAALLFYTCLHIRTDPMDAVGQVSGLAALGLRFSLFAVLVVVALIIAARWRGGAEFERATRLACATLAGAFGGMLAGGLAVVLYKTPYGLAGTIGDSAVLASWAEGVRQGHLFSPYYPPLQPYIIAWLADLFDIRAIYAMKHFGILGLGLIPPCAYLAWRLVFRPIWALGIGLVAVLGIVEAYRPYPMLVLAVFIPISIRFLQQIRRVDEGTWLQLLRAGVAFGLAYGSMFLLYSSWFAWSMPGLVISAAIVFPWRRAPKPAAVLLALTAVIFVLFAARYLYGFVTAPPLRDEYFPFDALVDPAYVAMWRGGLPGIVADPKVSIWPPLGELGGVGVFTILAIIGAGVSVAYARTRTFVISVGMVVVGAWFLRLWYARQMWKTQLVQLWPRTTAEIYYGLVLLAGFGVYAVVTRKPETDVARRQSKVIGATIALAIVFAMAGSHITQRYMPTDDATAQSGLAWRAHRTAPYGSNEAKFADAIASSSFEGWIPENATDGKHNTAYSSAVGDDDREEWIELTLLKWGAQFNTIVLYPAVDGFPTEFTVELWDGDKWVIAAWRRDIHPDGPVRIFWGRPDTTSRVRIRAKHLGRTAEGKRAFRLAEVELFFEIP